MGDGGGESSMTRRTPKMEAIEAFIEAARAPNFRTAAERCALSPAAFSRRIQAASSSAPTGQRRRSGGGIASNAKTTIGVA
jgi:LysR family transcriptional regulator, glycine cleavage system transcriptional activator